jgi:hypothetical protein
MVAEAERTWLQNLVIRSGLGGHDVDLVVDDRDGLATSMSTEQRTSLRALLVALVQTPEFEPQELRIRIVRDGELCRAAVAARFGGQDSISRIAFWPYLALLRAAFNDLDVEFDHPTLRLRFWYD